MIKGNTVLQQAHGPEHLVKVQRITILEELNVLMNPNALHFYKAIKNKIKIRITRQQANTNKTIFISAFSTYTN